MLLTLFISFSVSVFVDIPFFVNLNLEMAEKETNEKVLARRRKEIEKAKELPTYKNYLDQVPKHARLAREPRTPDPERKASYVNRKSH